jgi:hypothetical protein
MGATAQDDEMTPGVEQLDLRLFLLRDKGTSSIRQQGKSLLASLFPYLGRGSAHAVNELFVRGVYGFHIVGGTNPLFSQTLFFESNEIKIRSERSNRQMVAVLCDHFLMDGTGAMNADARRSAEFLNIAQIALENLHRSSPFDDWQASEECLRGKSFLHYGFLQKEK